MKHKRILTDDQRAAARDRMNKARAIRMANLERVREVSIARAPEVQAVIDGMTPERKARLAMIQAKNLQTPEGQAALARHEAEKLAALSSTQTLTREQVAEVRDERRIGSREVVLIVRTDGLIVSQYSPCVCGAGKREWHKICLRQSGES